MGLLKASRFLRSHILLLIIASGIAILSSSIYTVFSKEFAPRSVIPSSSLQVLPGAVTQRINANQSGTLTSYGGYLTVRLPAAAVEEDLDVTLTPLQPWVWGANGMRVVNMFELKAEAVNRGRARVSQFDTDIDVTFSLSENYAENELRGRDLHSLALYHLNESNGNWEPLEGSLIRGRQPKLIAKTRHFSVFGSQASPIVSGPGTVLGFQTDPYSAAAVSTIPLEVPTGPGGLAPKVALSYNSGLVDDMKNHYDVGGWVGIGWSLKLGSVSKNLETNVYFLDLGGAGYELVRDAQDATDIYHTKHESGFKIKQNSDNWEVWDRSGTYYKFGGTTDTKQFYGYNQYSEEFGCENILTYYRYDLGLIRDVNGNQIDISYNRDIVGGSSCTYYSTWDVVSAYPLDITYGKNVNVSGSLSRFNIHFNASSDTYHSTFGWIRDDLALTFSGARIRDNKRLNSVEIKVDGDANGSYETLVRKYVLAFNTTTQSLTQPYPAGRMTLTSFQQYGANGSSTLPAMQFTYSTPTTYFYDSSKPTNTNVNPGNPAQFTWPHLATTTSGYGATVSYSYTSKPDPSTSPNLIWVRATNTERSTAPGIGTTQTVTYSYTGDPKYKVINSNNRWLDEYRGFEQARETDAAGNYVEHYYYTINTPADGKDADKLHGKEYKTEWKDSSNNLLRKAEYSWNFRYWGSFYNPVFETYYYSTIAWYSYLEQEDVTIGNKVSRTRYIYDLPSNDPYYATGRGAKTRQNNDGETSTTADDSTVFWDYNKNLTDNILDTVKQQKTYPGNKTSDDGTNLKAETYYFYDGNNNDNQLSTAPTKGNLTRLKQATTVGSSYVNSYFTYDTRRNRLTSQDPNGNTTTWTYGSSATDYHNLPLTEMYPAIGGSSMSESATWDHAAGKILAWVDVNSQTTTYEYDTFKRVIKVFKPGDSLSNPSSPTFTYDYNNWGTINNQNLQTTTKVDGSNNLWNKQFFDGIGRVVQVHSLGETISGTTYTNIDKTTTYSNRGLVDKDYVGQKLSSGSVTNYYTPGGGWQYTTFAYDALARVTTQTNPDGTTISHSYSDWNDQVTNERGYKKKYYNDAFGRLVKVEEYDTSHSLYSTTTYAYDVLNNLTTTTDNSSNQVSITYNSLSRKTGMTDPDMGTWSYTYDSNGNLTNQTDAKSQIVYFQYDALNRMTQKCTSSSCSGTVIASFGYDGTSGGNVGKGRRTSMADTGSATYTYDSRGRMTQETKTIDGTQYTTGYAYDGADRLTVVTYPGGETATQAYNGPFTNTLTSSVSGNIVTGAVHNQLGALSQMDLNNGLRSIFQYHGIDSLDSGDASNYWGKLYKVRTYKTSDSSDKLFYKYWWDGAGNLTKRVDSVLGATEDFTYDALDRITGVSNAYTSSYAYNAIGNITSADGLSYTYGSSSHVHAVTAYDGWIFGYDANGNMTTWMTNDYTQNYDVENRMVGNWNGYHAYAYDGDGNRVKREYGMIDRDGFNLNADGTALTSHKTDIRQWSWSAGDSHWTVQSNKAAYDGTSDNQQAVIDAGRADVTLEADVTTSATSNKTLGLVWRWSSSSNYYIAYLIPVDGLVKVSKVVSGSWTGLVQSNITLATSTTYHMKVVANGSSFKVYVNGTLYIDSTDSTFTTQTSHGIATNGSAGVSDMRWDNVQIGWIYLSQLMLDTTVYPNKYMEKNVTSNHTTLYYYFGGQMVALKKDGTLEYLQSDHLGSTSVTTDTSGAVTSRTRYKPFGEVLLTSNQETSGTLNTEHKFTGQIYDTGTNFYYYNARYYDRTLRRFTQADTIVQDYANPQSLNRYSYVLNNPLKYYDPTGHSASNPLGVDDDWWECILSCPHTQAIRDMLAGQGIDLGGASGEGSSSDSSSDVGGGFNAPDVPVKQNEPPLPKGAAGRQPPSCNNLDACGGGKLKPSLKWTDKIAKQLEKRGWSEKTVKETYETPVKTQRTTDYRYNPDGTRTNEPATRYFANGGHYIVVNDRTGDIVQVSNRNKPNWAY